MSLSNYIIGFLLCCQLCLWGQSQAVQNYGLYESNFPSTFVLGEQLASGLVFDILEDRQGFMWFATESGLLRYDGYEFKTYKTEPGNLNSLSGNIIDCLLEDVEGFIWIGSQNSGLNKLDPKTGKITRYTHQQDEESISHNRIQDLCQDKFGNIWIATDGGGLNRFNLAEQIFDVYAVENSRLISNHVHDVHVDTDGTLWVGSYQGLLRYEPEIDSFSVFGSIFKQDTLRNIISTIHDFSEDKLCIGTKKGGMFLFDKNMEEFTVVQQDYERERQQFSWTFFHVDSSTLWLGTRGGIIAFNKEVREQPLQQIDGITFQKLDSYDIFDIHRSRSGLIWIATNHGVYQARPNYSPFESYYIRTPKSNGEISVTGITNLELQGDSSLWVGTSRGLFRMDLNTRRFLSDIHPLQQQLENMWMEEFFIDSRGDIWIGVINNFDTQFEVWRYSTQTHRVENITRRCPAFYVGVTRSITEDKAGNIWFGTWDGLVHYFIEQDTFVQYKKGNTTSNSISSNLIQKVLCDKEGRLWIGTNDAGVSYMDVEQLTFSHFSSIETDTTSLLHNRVQDIYQDRQGNIWIATAAGLCLYQEDKQQFDNFYQKQASNDLLTIIGDKAGTIWLGLKDEGLLSFNPKTEEFRSFKEVDGIQDNEFWSKVAFQTSTGLIGLGGNRGFNLFNPVDFKTNEYLPPVVFTDFLLFNQSLDVDANGILSQAIEQTKHITLRHNENVITFRYAALSFLHSDRNQYAYQLEGFDENWQYVGMKREATYTNLDPGDYIFRVKAANNDGFWNEEPAELLLTILPPWWKTWWFYLLLAITVLGIAIWLYQFQLNRKLAQAEAIRLKEIDRLKTKLYTNITHEFRTPLTIILGMADELKTTFQHQTEDRLNQSVRLIKKSGNELLRLVNQILDLNRLEAGKLEMQYVQADVIRYFKYLLQSFESLARQQEISLFFDTEIEYLQMDVDPEQLQHIISNLLSNAIKFTPAKGAITMKVQRQPDAKLQIQISDTGKGISEEQLPHIFERFYQVDMVSKQTGTGIGLAITKELVERMAGSVAVESRLHVGTTFTVVLPISQKATVANLPASLRPVVEESIRAFPAQNPTKVDAPVILIVEDEPEVQQYISLCLEQEYHVELADDGQQGWEKALDLTPDLIISDVMMPELDGFELCHKLKMHQSTSHIPVVLLTAKADAESRIAGLRRGADAYLAKPFDKQELLVRIEQLLELRRRLQVFYLRQFGIDWEAVGEQFPSDEEQLFLEQVRKIVESNFEHEAFSVEILCREMGLSHSQLHRKMTALTGQSTQKFIRSLQFQKARHLLLETKLSISEVAYKSGFNDPAYFAKVFSQAYQQSPRSFRQSAD